MTAVEMKKPDTVCLEEKTNELEQAFFSSSHFTRWLLPSTAEVRNRRWQTFEKEIKDKVSAVDSDGSASSSFSSDITEEDYFDYCLMLCEKCLEICKTFRLSEEVQWTSVVLLKRSLLDTSALEWSSHACLVGCVCLIAAKSEGSVIGLSDLAKVFRQSTLSEEIMASEMRVLESVKFDLRVWQSLPTLRSLCNDFWKFLEKKKQSSRKRKSSKNKRGSNSGSSLSSSKSSALDSIELRKELRQSLDDQSTSILKLCLQTDCPLVYTPSQMSLACFLLAASNTDGLKDCALEYFNALFSRSLHSDKLRQCTESIQRGVIESMQRSQEFNESSRVRLQNKMDRLRRSVVSAQRKKRTLTDSVSTDQATSSVDGTSSQRLSDRTIVKP